MTGKLDGKVAMVTGGARGIGRAYAKRLAGLGAKVAVLDIDLESWREFEAEAASMTAPGTVAEIEAAGGTAMGLQADVKDEAAVKAAVALVLDAWGRIDVLVANAGMSKGSPDETKASLLSGEQLQFITATNLFGTVHSVAAVAPVMKAQRSGKIVTVASLAARGPSADGSLADYGPAKAAIAHYTKYLAQELGPFGITANTIAPGVTASGRIASTLLKHEEHVKALVETIALRRLGTVEDCAKVMDFLATDLSDYVTGALIPVDGGMRIG